VGDDGQRSPARRLAVGLLGAIRRAEAQLGGGEAEIADLGSGAGSMAR
jgi:hypothetical protein